MPILSLALVHWPDLEYWTQNHFKWDGSTVEKVGINFGAPGDRMDNGTLWLDYPSVGGSSPNLPVKVDKTLRVFRAHSIADKSEKSWVINSGVSGLGCFELQVDKSSKEKSYTVRVYFKSESGKGAQNTYLQDKKVGSVDSGKSQMKEFKGVKIQEWLKLRLESAKDDTFISGIELVKE
jgi:hypothetical protein